MWVYRIVVKQRDGSWKTVGHVGEKFVMVAKSIHEGSVFYLAPFQTYLEK